MVGRVVPNPPSHQPRQFGALRVTRRIAAPPAIFFGHGDFGVRQIGNHEWQRIIFAAMALVLALTGASPVAFAGMDETLKAIQQSEFTFARTTSEVPFFPVGWVQDRFYPRAVFQDQRRFDSKPSSVLTLALQIRP